MGINPRHHSVGLSQGASSPVWTRKADFDDGSWACLLLHLTQASLLTVITGFTDSMPGTGFLQGQLHRLNAIFPGLRLPVSFPQHPTKPCPPQCPPAALDAFYSLNKPKLMPTPGLLHFPFPLPECPPPTPQNLQGAAPFLSPRFPPLPPSQRALPDPLPRVITLHQITLFLLPASAFLHSTY